RTEVEDARAQLSVARAALASAHQELRRALGVVGEAFELQGTLSIPSQPWDADTLTRTALDRRGDRHARQSAVDEADARLRLARADRRGNPNVGLAYEYDDARANLIGIQFSLPLPVLNKRQGEIMQRQAERDRAASELNQTEVT